MNTEQEGFSTEELDALADITTAPMSAIVLLQQAGYPANRVPMAAANHYLFWRQVDTDIRLGVMADGRAAILKEACRTHPFHKVLCRRRPRPWRVLLVGASPPGAQQVRSELEFKAIKESVDERDLTVDYVPAARIEDLIRLREEPFPHILHLACHGQGEIVFFVDGDGNEHALNMRDQALTLAEYRRGKIRPRLRAIILNACYSEDAAKVLRAQDAAEAIIAHSEEVPDEKAIKFAAALHGMLSRGDREPGPAARAVMSELVTQDPSFRRLQDGLVTL